MARRGGLASGCGRDSGVRMASSSLMQRQHRHMNRIATRTRASSRPFPCCQSMQMSRVVVGQAAPRCCPRKKDPEGTPSWVSSLKETEGSREDSVHSTDGLGLGVVSSYDKAPFPTARHRCRPSNSPRIRRLFRSSQDGQRVAMLHRSHTSTKNYLSDTRPNLRLKNRDPPCSADMVTH